MTGVKCRVCGRTSGDPPFELHWDPNGCDVCKLASYWKKKA